MNNSKMLEPPEYWSSLNLIACPDPPEQQYYLDEMIEPEEDEKQYWQLCAAACGTILYMDTCIMIYENPEWGIGELTYCNSCYWKHKLYKDDMWSDNVDEIVDHLKRIDQLNDAQICDIAPVVARHRWVQQL